VGDSLEGGGGGRVTEGDDQVYQIHLIHGGSIHPLRIILKSPNNIAISSIGTKAFVRFPLYTKNGHF